MNNQEIINNAPEGATHVSEEGTYFKRTNKGDTFWWVNRAEWMPYNSYMTTRSLADVAKIVELENDQTIRDLRQQAKGMDIVASHLNETSIHGAVIKNAVEDLADSHRQQAYELEQGE